MGLATGANLLENGHFRAGPLGGPTAMTGSQTHMVGQPDANPPAVGGLGCRTLRAGPKFAALNNELPDFAKEALVAQAYHPDAVWGPSVPSALYRLYPSFPTSACARVIGRGNTHRSVVIFFRSLYLYTTSVYVYVYMCTICVIYIIYYMY